MGALVIGQFSALLLSFLVPMILAHLLSNQDFGLYSQFNLILGFSLSFFSFGISSELYFFYPNSNYKQRRIVVFQSFIMLLILGLLTLAIFFIPSFRALFITNQELESRNLYLIFGIFFSIPTVIISNLYVVKHDNKTSALYLPFSTLFRVSLIFLFYWYSPTIDSIFFALLVNYALLFFYVFFYVLKEVDIKCNFNLWDYRILKKQLSYSFPLGIGNSSLVIAQQIDKLILLSFVAPATYGIYAIAFYGVPGLTQLYLSISQVYIPRMAVAFGDSHIELALNLYKSLILKTLSYTIPIIFIIALFSPVIVPFLFSFKYIESVPYFQLYLLTFIFSAMGNGISLRASGKTKRTLNAYLYSLIPIIPFSFFAIKFYGLHGAIGSAILSSILPRVLLTRYDLGVFNCKLNEIFPWKEIGKITLIASLILIPFYFLFQYFTIGIVLSTICISFYLLLVVIIEIHFDLFIISKKESILAMGKVLNFIGLVKK